jgi:methylated-DNA-[protein]-cysteine S-methyltransferase
MGKAGRQKVYFSKFNHEAWNFYIAATNKGLCFVGSQSGPKEEIEQWLKKQLPNAELKEDKNKLSVYFNQFKEYFSGKRQSFYLPLDLYGTKFQKSVWTELQKIPFGETSTYSDIAEKINKPSAFRAVGSAIGANPVMIVIPCHRVIGKSGRLTGFRGGLLMKQKLLALEKK